MACSSQSPTPRSKNSWEVHHISDSPKRKAAGVAHAQRLDSMLSFRAIRFKNKKQETRSRQNWPKKGSQSSRKGIKETKRATCVTVWSCAGGACGDRYRQMKTLSSWTLFTKTCVAYCFISQHVWVGLGCRLSVVSSWRGHNRQRQTDKTRQDRPTTWKFLLCICFPHFFKVLVHFSMCPASSRSTFEFGFWKD